MSGWVRWSQPCLQLRPEFRRQALWQMRLLPGRLILGACWCLLVASYHGHLQSTYASACALILHHSASMTASLCLTPPFCCGVCCSDALEEHVAAVVSAEVARTLGKCGLAEVVDRLRELQASDACVRFTGGRVSSKPAAAAAPCRITHNSVCCMLASHPAALLAYPCPLVVAPLLPLQPV
jgi:hypothetical protein